MQNERSHLKWCLGQSKGIKLARSSDNLAKAYMQKSRNALMSMEINAKAGITEWAVSASYYAKYFAVYALFMKIGVKCEIHDCTITLFNYLFADNVHPSVIQEFKQSKENRIEMQYFTRETKTDTDKLMAQTKNFVLEIEKIYDVLNSEKIVILQSKLKGMSIRDDNM